MPCNDRVRRTVVLKAKVAGGDGEKWTHVEEMVVDGRWKPSTASDDAVAHMVSEGYRGTPESALGAAAREAPPRSRSDVPNTPERQAEKRKTRLAQTCGRPRGNTA